MVKIKTVVGYGRSNEYILLEFAEQILYVDKHFLKGEVINDTFEGSIERTKDLMLTYRQFEKAISIYKQYAHIGLFKVGVYWYFKILLGERFLNTDFKMNSISRIEYISIVYNS